MFQVDVGTIMIIKMQQAKSRHQIQWDLASVTKNVQRIWTWTEFPHKQVSCSSVLLSLYLYLHALHQERRIRSVHGYLSEARLNAL